MIFEGLQSGTYNPQKSSADERSKNMIIKMLDYLKEKRENRKKNTLNLYTHAEFDSNQTLFEFIFNNNDLYVEAVSTDEACILLYIVKYIIEDIFYIDKNNNDFVKNLVKYD